jgi:outer membrane protein assembly factor BamB
VGGRLVDSPDPAARLLALDDASGAIAWKRRYVWMSWVKSSATIRDRVAYVGSSDAAALLAVDTRTGRPRWTTDASTRSRSSAEESSFTDGRTTNRARHPHGRRARSS